MPTIVSYLIAAFAEIAGCFAFWAWLRLGRSVFWTVPGVLLLLLFAFMLTRVDVGYAGRAYAAYGGIYIAAGLVWLWVIEDVKPDRWDVIGATICIAGAAVIVFGSRSGS